MKRKDNLIINLIIEILTEIRSNIFVKKHRKIICQKKNQKGLKYINDGTITIRTDILTIESEVLRKGELSYEANKIITASKLVDSQLAYLKQIIFQKKVGDKYLILDVDNRENMNLINSNNINKVIYCSLCGDNILIKKQIKVGGIAVYIKDNNLVIFDGEDELPILAIYRLFNLSKKVDLLKIKSYLFIVAFAFIYRVPLYLIRSFFCNYSPLSEDDLPGIFDKSNNKKEFTIK